MRSNLKAKITVVILLLALIGACAYVYLGTDLVTIQSIEYNSDANVSDADIAFYAQVAEGMRYFEVDAAAVEKALEAHPYIERARVEKHFPNRLQYVLTYRQHYLTLHHSDIFLSLDRTLHVLEVLEAPREGYQVNGFAFDNFVAGQVVQAKNVYVLERVVDLIELLRVSGMTHEYTLNYKQYSIWAYSGQLAFKFGDGSNIEKRFNDCVSIYNALIKEGISSGIVDVSTDGLPVYRPFGE